ncbi:unnamed protein product [Miscanthus lutarioriparius]|uniref:Disease resistance protein RPM1 n=1 Tax=Miscanthus lutarioriparius TaxID=422564 RepID=A0A811NG44_9POAL|nr:unnamed protein product [Miscanthus lutarioriparius]
MADMALGLTKKAVEGTVSRVLAAIDEDTKLKSAVKQDLRFIVGEFQMMESFLEMANDNKERTSNKVVNTWVRQLRELAFDVEDCVEFVIHLDTTSARAFAQLKQLNARVDEVSQRNTRYKLLGGDDSGSSTTPSPVPPEQLEADAFASTVDILRDLWEANAKQSSSLKCNLKYLVDDGRCNELRVISVWRAAGVDVEAAHILNAAYLDPEICKEFKARARVKLMHPFNIQQFLKSLLNQLYVTSQQQDTLSSALPDLLRTNGDSVIQDKLRQLLSKHKYLVILEDLSSAVDWDLIRLCLPDLGNGSRIVISTQQVGIALSCTGEPYRVLQLALLPNNDRYIYAFYKPSGIGITELVRQLGQRRVIPLWGDKGDDTRSLVRDVYDAIRKKTAEFKGVINFKKCWWVNVPSPFSLEGFYRRLSGYVRHGYENPESYFAGQWSKEVCENRYLFVIEGLRSKEDWDLIKDKLVPENTMSCIVIIANEEAVAKYIADEDNSSRKDYEEQEEANNAAIIGPLFAQKEEYYSWGHDRFRGHGCSRRIDEALFQFEPFITPDQDIELVTEIIVGHVFSCGVKAKLSFLVFDDKALQFERFGWVDVPEPFDLAEFSRRLLLDFHSDDPGKMEKTAVGIIQGHNPIQQCYEIMRRHRCLVVIDGLRSTRDWDSIEQALWCHHHPEASILVITTDESVAKHCVAKDDLSCERIIPMRALDDKSALELFIKVAEKQKNESITEKNLKHAERIVPKCGGLPKIIDAVARSPCSFWENINSDLVTKLKNDPKLRGVLSWMHSYIDGRSDSVKPCIFYLSVFPTNYKIRKAHLLRRWIAEGYCRDTTGSSAKENAERLFDELFSRDIIQTLPSMPVCQISGFFREYIISQPMEDNLVFVLEGHRKPNSQRTVQHLTIMEDWEREKHVFESIDVSRLRSLTVYGKWKPFFISDKMKRIRVLDLEGTSGVEDCCLKHIFEILLSLKFICLRGCKSITCLPKTMGGLRQLESLDVSGTSIVTLPRAIIKLQKIQYIRAGCKFLPDEDCTSAASEVGGQKKLVGCCWTSTKSSQGSDDAVGSQQPSGTTATPEAEGSDGGHQGQHQHHKQRHQKIKKMGRRWTSRLSSCSWFAHNNINGGVEVPVGIEDMPSLHTLGTVNISRGGGKDFLTMLKLKTTLPQLFKLSVCGINKENWKDLCDALSAHDHLESLSLGLDNDFTEDIYFGNLPKALKSFKVYGHIHRLPAWIKDGRLEANLKKFDIEAIISRQECMDQLVESLPHTKNGGISRRLCIKPTRQVRELEFRNVMNDDISRPQVLKIDCSSALEVAFQTNSIATEVNVLIIHCYKGSDFRISVSGLKYLDYLETVWLKGLMKKQTTWCT